MVNKQEIGYICLINPLTLKQHNDSLQKMAVFRKRNGKTVVIQPPEITARIRKLTRDIYTYILADDAKAVSLLAIDNTPQTPDFINNLLRRFNPELAKRRADELELTALKPLVAGGALAVDSDADVKTYRKTELGSGLFCPIILYALLWFEKNLDRCMRDYLGKYNGKEISTPYQRADLIKVISDLCRQASQGEAQNAANHPNTISLDMICEQIDSIDWETLNTTKKRHYLMAQLHHFETLGLVKCVSIKNTTLYQWKKENLFYPLVDYVGREYVESVTQFLFERRNGQPISPIEVKTPVEPKHRIWIYQILEKLESAGYVEKTELPETVVVPLELFKALYPLFMQMNQAVEEHVIDKAQLLTEMRTIYSDFKRRPDKYAHQLKEMVRRYKTAVGN